MAGTLSSSDVTTVYQTGYGVGAGTGANREDLSPVVFNIDRWDTPIFTMAKKGVATHTTHEWIEYALRSTSIAGAAEGAGFDEQARPNPRRKSTNTHIFRADTEISNTEQAVDSVGALGKYRTGVVDALKEIRRNFERKAMSAAAASTTGGTGAARLMKTLQDFIQVHAYHADDAATLGGGADTGSGHILLETSFVRVIQNVYQDGGNPRDVIVSPAAKVQIAQWGASNTFGNSRVIAAADNTLDANVDFYNAPVGGLMRIHTNWLCPTGTSGTADAGVASADGKGSVFFLDMKRISADFLRRPRHIPIATNADSTRGIVLMEACLMVANGGDSSDSTGGHGRFYGVANVGS